MTTWLIANFPGHLNGLIVFWTVTCAFTWVAAAAVYVRGGRKWRGGRR